MEIFTFLSQTALFYIYRFKIQIRLKIFVFENHTRIRVSIPTYISLHKQTQFFRSPVKFRFLNLKFIQI